MQFDAKISNLEIHCFITSDIKLLSPIFCFSCLAPIQVAAGGELAESVGGYSEVKLPDLEAGHTHLLVINYKDESLQPFNRAWLPLSPYLREISGKLHKLPALPSGVKRIANPHRPLSINDISICPPPQDYQPSTGILNASGFSANDEVTSTVNLLGIRSGLGPFLHKDGIELELINDRKLKSEGYKLNISSDKVCLFASDRAGYFYGAVSLLQLLNIHGGQIPCCEISDWPRFEWRGQHLDCARHFYSVDSILRLLDLLALLKFNRFHWHFADDEAFRLELKSLPELSLTHYRGEGELLPGVFGGGIRSGGKYTREDATRIIEHAKLMNIEIMPEIEIPAHSLAIAKVFPDTRDPKDQNLETSVQGYKGNVLNPAMTRSWQVWETMIAEVSEIFPFQFIHLGGDELPPDAWVGSPAAKKLRNKHKISNNKDLLGWILNNVAAFLSNFGKLPAAWVEAAGDQIGIEHDAILFSWSNQLEGVKAAEKGYKVVMCPAQHVYLDMAHSGEQDDWGARWAATIGLEDTISWNPIPDLQPSITPKILGVQGAFWSEFTTEDQQIEPMLAPRILGVSCMNWSSQEKISMPTLTNLVSQFAKIFKKMNWSTRYC